MRWKSITGPRMCRGSKLFAENVTEIISKITKIKLFATFPMWMQQPLCQICRQSEAFGIWLQLWLVEHAHVLAFLEHTGRDMFGSRKTCRLRVWVNGCQRCTSHLRQWCLDALQPWSWCGPLTRIVWTHWLELQVLQHDTITRSLPKCWRWLAKSIVYIPNHLGSLWSLFHLTLDHALNYTPSCCKFSDGLCTNALSSLGCWVWTFIGNSLQIQNWKHSHLVALDCHTAQLEMSKKGISPKLQRCPETILDTSVDKVKHFEVSPRALFVDRIFAEETLELINFSSVPLSKMQGLVRWKKWQWYMREVSAHAYTNKSYGILYKQV